MDPETILFVIVGIAVAGYLFEQWLEHLNVKAMRADIPDEVAGFYDRARYVKSLSYHREQTRFSRLSSGLTLLLYLAVLVSGGFGWLDEMLRRHIGDELVLAVAFFGVVVVASDLLSLPFQLYHTFVIEEKYGFNKTTYATFISDKIKEYALVAVFAFPLLALLVYLVLALGPSFWIWFALVASVFTLLMNIFYASVILPLFNKLTPLPDGELKTAIFDFARKVDFPLQNIFVIDGSRRSSKANAFFSGLGRRKKIVLYDTLIEKHTTEELVAVLAHEVGHFKKKHIGRTIIMAMVQIFFMMFILSLMVYNEDLSAALGGRQLSVHLNLIVFSILLSPVLGISSLLMKMYSRKNEFEADAYAAETFDRAALALALKRLSVDSLSNLYPHPLYVFVHYSHPPLLRRLAALKGRGGS